MNASKQNKLINTLSNDSKKTFGSRALTSFYIFLYFLFIIFLAFLGGIKTPIYQNLDIVSRQALMITFASLFMLSFLWINYFVAVELDFCFLGNKRKIDKWIIFLLFIFIEYVCFLPFIVLNYGFLDTIENEHGLKANIFTLWRNIGLISWGSSVVIGYVILFLMVYFGNKKTKFNLVVFPLLTLFIGVFFFYLFYISLIKFVTVLFFILVVTSAFDTFAYVGGTFFGRHKMSPTISPKKTWEGFFISLFITLAISLSTVYGFTQDESRILPDTLIGYHEGAVFDQNTTAWWLVVSGLTIVLCLADTIGDLAFSLFKRHNQIKDYSNILKKHGGILDRIDALIFMVSLYTTISFLTMIINEGDLTSMFNIQII